MQNAKKLDELQLSRPAFYVLWSVTYYNLKYVSLATCNLRSVSCVDRTLVVE